MDPNPKPATGPATRSTVYDHAAAPTPEPTDPRSATATATAPASAPATPAPVAAPEADGEETLTDPGVSVQPDTSGETDPGASANNDAHPL